MPIEPIPEFNLDPQLSPAANPDFGRATTDKLLGLRELLEYYYAQSKKTEQKLAALETRAVKSENQLLLDMIQVADSFEDIFAHFAQDKKLKKQADALKAFKVTWDTLVHLLEKSGVYAVPILGRRYNDVMFQNVKIPEPWSVISASGVPRPDGESRVVQRVCRSLWVRVIDRRVMVIRRGQVVY